MKRHLVGLLPLVCLAPNALAQEQASEAGEYQQEGSSAVPETYMVQPGDTLWDISASVLQNPWYWPKIWSYNPDITNPHMIYPGDRIKFSQAGDQMPTLADYDALKNAMNAGEQVEFDDGQQNNGNENGNPNSLIANDNPAVKNRPTFEIISDQATMYRKPGTVQVMVESLLTEDELQHSGVIYKAAEEKVLLSTNDKIYLKFPAGQDVAIGERYLIFRTVDNIRHPKSKDKLGYLTQITGVAEVINVGEKVATAIIRRSSNIVERGQYVTPMKKDVYRLVEPKANENEARGVVLATKFMENDLIGEQEIVFVDKGSADGVALGNTFNAVYQGDPLLGKDEDLPEEEFATLRVVDVKEKFSTCVVINASREMEIGNSVVMKPW